MEKTLKVEGMSCAHCVAAVERALKEIDGVTGAKASLDEKNVVVVLEKDVPSGVLKAAIEEEGYDVVG